MSQSLRRQYLILLVALQEGPSCFPFENLLKEKKSSRTEHRKGGEILTLAKRRRSLEAMSAPRDLRVSPSSIPSRGSRSRRRRPLSRHHPKNRSTVFASCTSCLSITSYNELYIASVRSTASLRCPASMKHCRVLRLLSGKPAAIILTIG